MSFLPAVVADFIGQYPMVQFDLLFTSQRSTNERRDATQIRDWRGDLEQSESGICVRNA